MSTPPVTGEPSAVVPATPPSSLLRGTLMRFAADGSGIVLGMVATIVTARVLGPAGRGTLAALAFVTTLIAQCSLLGLGDAAVVRIGQAKATVQEALSSSVGAVFLASLVGAGLVLVYSVLQLPVDDPNVRAAIAVACATVVVSTVGQLFVFVVYATQRVVAVSVLTIVLSATAALGVVVFCAWLDLDVLGGALAGLVASLVGLAAGATMLRRARLRFGLRVTSGYLRPALSYGVRTQLANALAYSSARLDLLFVYALASRAEAGIYSVALTLGTVTGFVAIGLSFASFPRMARMTDVESFDLTARMTRIMVILGMALAAILAVSLPTLIAVLLGHEYDDVLAPAIVLLVANVLWGGQWLLSRAMASRGDPTLLLRSFTLNLATMAAGDVVLVPAAGAVGAAVGALVAAAAGLALCLKTYRGRGVAPSAFVPRRADIVDLWGITRRFGAQMRSDAGRLGRR